MPRLYVHYKNHLDLTWRRPRYTAGNAGGNTDGWKITPYSELQERQIDRGFDFIRSGGSYSLEQTVSLREYLDRNPDCMDEVREWLADGRLTVHGGGESVVDYNLPDGESIIRNHLYSRLWLKNTFDYQPRLADCPDTFGLSANLPELFRQLGYPGILTFHRVFRRHKPYWRGLSGRTIALDTAYAALPLPEDGYDDCLKCRVCTICKGDGCPACEGSGIYLNPHPDNASGGFVSMKKRLQKENGDFSLCFAGEEAMAAEGAVDALRRIAGETGYELVFTDVESMSLMYNRELIENVDHAPDDQIDERAEGNPVAAGCYTTRIKIKQESRRCEAALRSAERLAAAAAADGVPYPARTLEKNWIKLAFLHFHDAIPASHSDDAYAELMETGRQIRASVARIVQKSAKKLIGKAEIADGEGIPFIVFNPLEFDVKNARLTGTVRCDRYVTGGSVLAPDGSVYPVLSVKRTNAPGYAEALVEFIGSLPAFGYAVLRFLPDSDECEVPAPKEMRRGFVMENEYLRVTFGEHSVTEVYDKTKERVLAVEGTFAPWLSDDAGHPWGRTNTIQYEERADIADYPENMLPAAEFSRRVTYEKRDGVQTARIYVKYARAEKQIRMLDWCAEFTLADTSRELDVKIRTSLDARDIRLSTHVVLPHAPADEMLDYEIPLGTIRRGYVNVLDQQLGYSDEWAALRYVSADMGDYRVTLCNNGTPAHALHRYERNHLTAALLRTPTQLCCGFGITGAIDTSEHEFRFTLAADADPMDAYRRGMVLNTEFPALFASEKKGSLPAQASFLRLPDNLPMLALKGAEDGNGFIVRYLGTGHPETLVFAAPAVPCDPLEQPTGEAVTEAEVPPYGIATFRISADCMRA
jgi:alpha-mannosidase